MDKSLKRFSALLLLIFLMGAFIACPVKLCCLKYEKGSDLAIYCNNHRDAVGKFIRNAENESEQITRLNNFKQFYESIKNCTTVQCIETQINNDTTLPGFQERYENEHEFAERDTQIDDSNLKAELILCGFKHAIDAFEKTLSKWVK